MFGVDFGPRCAGRDIFSGGRGDGADHRREDAAENRRFRW